MLVCSSWWQPAVFVTCVSRDTTARIHWSWRGSRGSEDSRTLGTDCRTFTKLGYRSLCVHKHHSVKARDIIQEK